MRVAVMMTVMTTMFLVGTILPTSAPWAAPSCDFVGMDGRDVVAGTKAGETMCLLGGNDYGHGNGGRDRLRGGTGRDALVGGAGKDKLKGGPGDDRLFATDQKVGNDLLRGGAGFDQCFADPEDIIRGCEQVHRGNTAATTDALTANSFDVTEIAEDALEELPPVGGGGGGGGPAPTPTQPPGPGFPPCTPPPPPGTTPAPCPGG